MGILACGGFASVALSASLAANGIEGAFAAFADFAGQFSCAGAGFLGQFFGTGAGIGSELFGAGVCFFSGHLRLIAQFNRFVLDQGTGFFAGLRGEKLMQQRHR